MRHLPQDSWTQTIIRDEHFAELVNPETAAQPEAPKFGPWALTNYQLASLTDAINRLYYVEATGKRIKPDTPAAEPVPRPGLQRQVRRQPDWAVAYLSKLRATG